MAGNTKATDRVELWLFDRLNRHANVLDRRSSRSRRRSHRPAGRSSDPEKHPRLRSHEVVGSVRRDGGNDLRPVSQQSHRHLVVCRSEAGDRAGHEEIPIVHSIYGGIDRLPGAGGRNLLIPAGESIVLVPVGLFCGRARFRDRIAVAVQAGLQDHRGAKSQSAIERTGIHLDAGDSVELMRRAIGVFQFEGGFRTVILQPFEDPVVGRIRLWGILLPSLVE